MSPIPQWVPAAVSPMYLPTYMPLHPPTYFAQHRVFAHLSHGRYAESCAIELAKGESLSDAEAPQRDVLARNTKLLGGATRTSFATV